MLLKNTRRKEHTRQAAGSRRVLGLAGRSSTSGPPAPLGGPIVRRAAMIQVCIDVIVDPVAQTKMVQAGKGRED